MLIKTIGDFRKAIRHGAYASGGYPCYFVMADGEALSFKAAKENRREIIAALGHVADDGWRPVAFEINWEDTTLVCAHSNEPIESAYGETDEN